MNLNVFNWVYSTRYYLTNPWKWVKELFLNIHAAWQRSVRGWAVRDCWELGPQLLQVLPEMLRYLEKNHVGYPADMTDEEWTEWLHKMANDIEFLQEEKWEAQNEFAEEFYRVSDETRRCEKDKYDRLRVTWSDTPDYKELSDKYFARSKELNEQWYVEAERVGISFFKAIPKLWD